MGKRSPKLEGKEAAVKALLMYVKEQSNMTFLGLERKFTPRKEISEKNANHGGTQWWRWIHTGTIPRVDIVRDVFAFACDQLIRGQWKENGEESIWAALLPAVIDARFSFLIEMRSEFLNVLEQLNKPQYEQARNPFVTENILRAASVGYFFPTEIEMRKIFWSTPDRLDAVYANNEYVPWHRIVADNTVERDKLEQLITEIFVNAGVAPEAHSEMQDFAKGWGLLRDNLESWANQMHEQILLDANSLENMVKRMAFLYPSEFKFTDDLDDSAAEAAKQAYLGSFNELEMAAKKFRDYSEMVKAGSRASLMYGFYARLSDTHFRSGGCVHRIGWKFPTIEIL